jgi:beta-carotene 15,15'-dioxygenase
MESTQLRLFQFIRQISTIAILSIAALSLVFSNLLGSDSMSWQVALAIFALVLGIPHGALDHLVTLPRSNPIRMTIFITIYVLIALIAIWAIVKWNVWGFIAVVAMSAIHFGIGDSAFIAELDQLAHEPRTLVDSFSYAALAGLVPVVIPLISSQSSSALEKVNPALLHWHGGYTTAIAISVSVVAALTFAILLIRKRYRDIADCAALIVLVTVAPPLVAFAGYFGCWHALRHTARLTSQLPKSITNLQRNKPFAAIRSAFIPGLPALLGTAVFVIFLTAFSHDKITDRLLWFTLVTIWALTVPHMLVTARLDRAALQK